MSHLQGKFVWFEHLSADPAAAQRFYQSLFGWHVEAMPMGEQRYTMIQNAGAGIGGLRDAPPGVPANWLSYLSVADVDASYQAALDAGATSRMAPFAMGDVGRSAVISDPTGATLALWQGAQDDPADTPEAPVGAFCWTELLTGDDEAAVAFYQKVFGYGHESKDMEPGGTYHLLTRDGKQRAGVMRSPDAQTPTMWQPYVAVADTDATVARAVELGARPLVPATDIPCVGRFAVLLDPVGAAVAVIKLLPEYGRAG